MFSFRREVAEAFDRFVSIYLVDKDESLCHGAVPILQRCLGEEMALH
jgi:hypothetical protein